MLSSLKLKLASALPAAKSTSSHNLSRGSSHADEDSLYNLPPKKVIKAIKPYYAQRAHELSFSTGDFFYVINDDNGSSTYQVVNPAARQRGFVPASYFISLDKLQQQQPQMGFINRDSANHFDNESRASHQSSSSEGESFLSF